ncbi:McrB family protein [Pseudoneobacillus sp. C159]
MDKTIWKKILESMPAEDFIRLTAACEIHLKGFRKISSDNYKLVKPRLMAEALKNGNLERICLLFDKKSELTSLEVEEDEVVDYRSMNNEQLMESFEKGAALFEILGSLHSSTNPNHINLAIEFEKQISIQEKQINPDRVHQDRKKIDSNQETEEKKNLQKEFDHTRNVLKSVEKKLLKSEAKNNEWQTKYQSLELEYYSAKRKWKEEKKEWMKTKTSIQLELTTKENQLLKADEIMKNFTSTIEEKDKDIQDKNAKISHLNAKLLTTNQHLKNHQPQQEKQSFIMDQTIKENQYLTDMMEKAEPIQISTNIADPKENMDSQATVAVLPITPVQSVIQNAIEQQDISENRFIEHFIATTQELGLLYAEKDLINFHTAMKSSNLVLLAGMSGTGKSKLVHAYSRALGLYSDQFTFIPVRPAWTDDADLIGYADTLHMVYRPGDSGLINALKQAEKDEDKLFILCFDEMNLARVEHYFSQFLSILEMEPGRRLLRLYNDELANRLYNSAQYPPTITIKDNVMFVGTVNLDESTYHFSDKVLDRANVIQLEILPFAHLVDLGEKKKVVHSRDQVINYETFDLFKNKNRSLELVPDELEFLWELHCELQKVNKQMGIGQRIVRQIDAYLKNLPDHISITREDAFDIQIVQRILTKIRGSEDQLHQLIGNYENSNGHISSSTLLDLLMKYSHLSHYCRTRKVLLNKARELKQNGYTI